MKSDSCEKNVSIFMKKKYICKKKLNKYDSRFWGMWTYFEINIHIWGSSKTFSNIKKMLNSLKWKLMRNNHVWRRIDETDVQWFLVTLCHILIKCEKKCIRIFIHRRWIGVKLLCKYAWFVTEAWAFNTCGT